VILHPKKYFLKNIYTLNGIHEWKKFHNLHHIIVIYILKPYIYMIASVNNN